VSSDYVNFVLVLDQVVKTVLDAQLGQDTGAFVDRTVGE
jgi:hypothetical protein